VGALFFKVLEMSLMGSVVILITILARFLLRKRSKQLIMILWAVVALRLMVPVGIESAFSIFNYVPLPTQGIPATVEVSEAALPDNNIDAPVAPVNNADITYDQAPANAETPANADVSGNYVKEVTSEKKAETKTLPDIKSVVAIVWFTGFVVLTTYFCIRYFDLKDKLKSAKKIGKNIYECSNVKSPFVFGFFVPKMYLPDTLDDDEREYVMAHEKNHIRHGDWIKKLLGIAVLVVHWFNPLVWVAFVLFEQDIEMSCDETTISSLSAELRKAYAIALVSYAKISHDKKYMVTPLGFSKNAFCKAEVTNRVMNIVRFKKGSKITTVAIFAAVLVLAAACAFNSKPGATEPVTSRPTEATVDITANKTEDTTADPTFEEEPAYTVEYAPIETKVTNEHKFENGVCKDCGMAWSEYYYETLGKLDSYSSGNWRSIYGPDSDSMFAPDDYVQFSAYSGDTADILYHCIDRRPVSESLDIYVKKDGKKTVSTINYTYDQGEFATDEPGVVDFKFTYWISITADAGDFDKVFASKEAFAKSCDFCLFVKNEGENSGSDVWSSMKESDIKKLFEGQENCTFYTKEQMIDMFWSRYTNMLQSVDNALVIMDTSLSDAGINWKK